MFYTTSIINKANIIITFFLLIIFSSCQNQRSEGQWIKADFHMHTTMTDGDNAPDEVIVPAIEQFGLDFVVLSEHGGQWYRVNENFQRTDNKGNVILDGKEYLPIKNSEASKYKSYSRTLQIKESSFPEILKYRKKYPDRLILQGLEWDIPGHDHGSVGIIADNADPVCRFHYLFDRGDINFFDNSGETKYCDNLHENALIGIKYLEEHYPDNSYFVVNHPSRKLAYTVSDFRDFNNASPDISIGFEGIPGHQKSPGIRCEYNVVPGDGVDYDSNTYGGADYFLAKLGGVWDAMLGEGRKFWVFGNSDYHRKYSDFLPGEYTVNYIWSEGKDYYSVVKGMRSGNVFVVENNLITDLSFKVVANEKEATMGQSLEVAANSKIKILIKYVSPQKEAFGKNLSVDHVDLICGEVDGLIEPASEYYHNPNNSTTRIEKQFNKSQFGVEGNYYYVEHEIAIQKPMYFRLRGTNVPVNTPGETDEQGNPLNDNLAGENNDEKALTDLWFYSNPVFIEIKN